MESPLKYLSNHYAREIITSRIVQLLDELNSERRCLELMPPQPNEPGIVSATHHEKITLIDMHKHELIKELKSRGVEYEDRSG